MTDAERLAEIRQYAKTLYPSSRSDGSERIGWLLVQLDAVLDDLRECSTFPCDTTPTGTHHANCRRCVAAETVGRLTL
jgi:hypothetical protein